MTRKRLKPKDQWDPQRLYELTVEQDVALQELLAIHERQRRLLNALCCLLLGLVVAPMFGRILSGGADE